MLHEHRPPTIQIHQVAVDEHSTTISYRPPQPGCFPVGGVVLYRGSIGPKKPGKVLAIKLGDGEGAFTRPRRSGDTGTLFLLAFDESPVRLCSTPAAEPMIAGHDLPPAVAESIRSSVEDFLIHYLTPERIAAAHGTAAEQLRADFAAPPEEKASLPSTLVLENAES